MMKYIIFKICIQIFVNQRFKILSWTMYIVLNFRRYHPTRKLILRKAIFQIGFPSQIYVILPMLTCVDLINIILIILQLIQNHTMKELATSDSLSLFIHTSSQGISVCQSFKNEKKSSILQAQQQRKQKYWNDDESLLYYRFVKNNIERLQKQKFTKKYNKFVKMAKFITSKDVAQCRSHHQKIIKKYLTLQSFLKVFESGKNRQKGVEIGIQVDITSHSAELLGKGFDGSSSFKYLQQNIHSMRLFPSPQLTSNPYL